MTEIGFCQAECKEVIEALADILIRQREALGKIDGVSGCLKENYGACNIINEYSSRALAQTDEALKKMGV